jgi:hypothetical protein
VLVKCGNLSKKCAKWKNRELSAWRKKIGEKMRKIWSFLNEEKI